MKKYLAWYLTFCFVSEIIIVKSGCKAVNLNEVNESSDLNYSTTSHLYQKCQTEGTGMLTVKAQINSQSTTWITFIFTLRFLLPQDIVHELGTTLLLLIKMCTSTAIVHARIATSYCYTELGTALYFNKCTNTAIVHPRITTCAMNLNTATQ